MYGTMLHMWSKIGDDLVKNVDQHLWKKDTFI